MGIVALVVLECGAGWKRLRRGLRSISCRVCAGRDLAWRRPGKKDERPSRKDILVGLILNEADRRRVDTRESSVAR